MTSYPEARVTLDTESRLVKTLLKLGKPVKKNEHVAQAVTHQKAGNGTCDTTVSCKWF
jgi:hypothetical protein